MSRTLLVAALALLAVAAAPAEARLIVGSTTDPVEYPHSQQADVTAVDIVYDDSAGDFDLRITLAQPPYGSDNLSGTLKLGQSWNGSECVTSSAPYDVAFANSWAFSYDGNGTPQDPFGRLFLRQSDSFISSPGVLTRPGIGSWEGTTLRAVARSDVWAGDAYKGRNYVCAGEFELFRSNQSRYFYGSGVDYVADFALGGGTPPPPAPPTPGVIDLASPPILDRDEYKPGDQMTGTVVWRNPSASSVTARHLVLTIRPVDVPGVEGYVGDFSPRIDDRTLAPGATINHTSSFRIPAEVTPGRWVLWAVWQDTGNVWHGAATLPFTVGQGLGQPSPPAQPSGTSGTPAPLVLATVGSKRLGRALRRGLLVEVQLSGAGRVKISAQLTRRQAARLGLARTIGTGSTSFADDGTKKVRVRFTRAARRALAHRRKVSITLKIEVTGASGKRRVVTRKLVLRR